jgi:transposase
MSIPKSTSFRYLGLDVHKYYLIAIGVDADAQTIYGPRRVELSRLETWMAQDLTLQDEVVLEMTTNTWQLYDELLPHVHSITVVHPPHIALITRAQVMTDNLAARILAQLHAKGMTCGIWVPPREVQDLRALLAQREKMTHLIVQAKNRLHSLLHRHHWLPPTGDPFLAVHREWWYALPFNPAEKTLLQTNLNTLDFACQQIQRLETTLKTLAGQDERIPLLIQIPGISLITALTILAAIGTILRFPSAKKLVGYAGLGARIHASGLTWRSGRITKAGRKDLRTALVESTQSAANTHPFWKAELARLEPRLGRNKAVVAIARKLLVTVWHVLTNEAADRHAQPELVARKLLQHAYKLGKANRSPADQCTTVYVRRQLNRLGLGADLKLIHWGQKKKPIPLPPSSLA